jgi:anti-sigma factor RsiW
MACEQWGGKLDLYLDGELASVEANTLGAHLRSCNACTSDVLQRVQLKRSVQIAGKRYAASAQLRNRIAKTVAAKPRFGFTWRWKLAAVMALVLIVVMGALYTSLSREALSRETAHHRVYSELADLHVATLASASPVDVLSTDRHTVKPWFQGKIPFTFNLPELQGSQFSLIGGRVAYLEQSAGAHLIFQVRQHKISVFIFPERVIQIPGLPSDPVNQLSFNMQSWTQGGLRYFVVGDAASDDIRALSTLLQGAR